MGSQFLPFNSPVPVAASSHPGYLSSTAMEAELRWNCYGRFPGQSGLMSFWTWTPNLPWEVCQLVAWTDAMSFLRLFYLQTGMGKHVLWAGRVHIYSCRSGNQGRWRLVRIWFKVYRQPGPFSKASLGPVSALAGSGSDSAAPVWAWSPGHFLLETILT